MARKRATAAAESPAENPATEIIQDVADSTRVPEGDASFDPAEIEKQAAAEPKKWADAKAEKKVDKTLCITDGDAGMRFQFNHIVHEAEIKFDGKPSPEVRGFLKDHGWKFDEDVTTQEKVWHKPINFETRERDRVSTKRDFWEAADMVREERGLPARSQEMAIPD